MVSMLKKPSALLAILVVISVLTVSGLYVYHDEVSSDLVVDFPTHIQRTGQIGSMYTIDAETRYVVMLESGYDIKLIEDSRKYCTLYATFCYDLNQPAVSIHYTFWTEKDSFVPQGSKCIAQGEDSSTYRYVDELTGNELTFTIENDTLHSIDFQGKTMIKSEGELKPVDFNLHVLYEQRTYLIHNYVMYDPADSVCFNIKGEENGVEKTGTVNFEPLVSKAMYNSYGSIDDTVNISHVLINISDTLLPDDLLSFYVSNRDEFVYAYETNIDWTFLTAENIFVEMNIQNSWNVDEGRIFNFEGTISTTTFDTGEAVTETLEFYYEVV